MGIDWYFIGLTLRVWLHKFICLFLSPTSKWREINSWRVNA